MTYQPDIYVDKLIPTSPERISRATMSLQAEISQNAGFVRFLQMQDTTAIPVQTVQAAVDLMAETTGLLDVEASSQTESAKNPDTVTQASSPENDVNSVTSRDSVSKDLKDANDMWVMDLKGLTAEDFKILQNLPVPSSVIQGALAQANFQHASGMDGGGGAAHYQGLGVSKGLQNMLEKAYKTQKPIRIDIADNASVILRLARNGRVSAEFVPGDQVAEIFYRQNLQELKSRLESKQLPVGELQVRSYKDSQEGRQQQQQQEQS